MKGLRIIIIAAMVLWPLAMGCSKKATPTAPAPAPAPVDDARARLMIEETHQGINELNYLASRSLKSVPDTTEDFWKAVKNMPLSSYNGYYLSDSYWRRHVKAKIDTSNYRVDTLVFNSSQTVPLRKFVVHYNLKALYYTRSANIGNNTIPPAAAGVVNRLDWEKDSVLVTGSWTIRCNRDTLPLSDSLQRDSSIAVDTLMRQACWAGYTLSNPGDTMRLDGRYFCYQKNRNSRWECQWQGASRGSNKWSGYHRKNPGGTINYNSMSTSSLTGSFTFPGDTTVPYNGVRNFQVGSGTGTLGGQKIADYYFYNHGFGYYKVASSGSQITFDW